MHKGSIHFRGEVKVTESVSELMEQKYPESNTKMSIFILHQCKIKINIFILLKVINGKCSFWNIDTLHVWFLYFSFLFFAYNAKYPPFFSPEETHFEHHWLYCINWKKKKINVTVENGQRKKTKTLNWIFMLY